MGLHCINNPTDPWCNSPTFDKSTQIYCKAYCMSVFYALDFPCLLQLQFLDANSSILALVHNLLFFWVTVASSRDLFWAFDPVPWHWNLRTIVNTAHSPHSQPRSSLLINLWYWRDSNCGCCRYFFPWVSISFSKTHASFNTKCYLGGKGCEDT